MGREAIPGEVYRLIVDAGQRGEVFGTRHFGSFEEAQAHVADAVRRYGRQGPVDSVALQRGNPSHRGAGDVGLQVRATGCRSVEHAWTTEKRWGADVVQRILAQAGIAVEDRAPAVAAPPSHARRAWSGSARSLHKPMLWHVATTAAIVALATIATLLLQTGGQPLTMLAALGDPRPTVKDELPFDARTSFDAVDDGGRPDAERPASEAEPEHYNFVPPGP